jgi:hypothetical protein
VIDHAEFTGAFGRLELQPKLLLQCGKNRWAGRGVGCCSPVGQIFQREVEPPGEAGLQAYSVQPNTGSTIMAS